MKTAVIIGVVVIGVVLLASYNAPPQAYASYVPPNTSSEGEMAAGANAVASVIGSSFGAFSNIFGAATAQNGF